jgi:mono/diheme cytochrome c family protein
MRCLTVASAILAALLALGSPLLAKKPSKAQNLGEGLRQAPPEARAWTNPYAGRPGAVLAGQKLFSRHCAQCHGIGGRGKEKAPDLHGLFVQTQPPGVLFWFLRNGNLKEGMPSWSSLPDQQLWQIVTYLMTLR